MNGHHKMNEQEKISLLNEVKRRFKAKHDENLDLLFNYLDEKFIDKETEITSYQKQEEETPF